MKQLFSDFVKQALWDCDPEKRWPKMALNFCPETHAWPWSKSI